MVFIINKDVNFYKIIGILGISVFHNDTIINISVKFWDL